MSAVVTLRPTAPGDLTEIDSQTPNQDYHFDKVGDESDSRYVGITYYTGGRRDLYKVPRIGSLYNIGSIESVKITVRCYGTSTSSRITTLVKTHDTEYYGTPTAPTGSWADYSTTYNTNPNTGVAWTLDEVDALQAGVKLVLNNQTSVYCSQVFVEVTCSFAIPLTTLDIHPSRDGYYKSLGTHPSTSSHYTLVDGETPDDADYVYGTQSAYQYQDTYGFPTQTNKGIIKNIRVYFRYNFDVDNSTAGYSCMRQSSTNNDVALLSWKGSNFVTWYVDYSTNPITGLPWSWDDIGAMEFGPRVTSSGTAFCCSYVMVRVYYLPNPSRRAHGLITF